MKRYRLLMDVGLIILAAVAIALWCSHFARADVGVGQARVCLTCEGTRRELDGSPCLSCGGTGQKQTTKSEVTNV